jgi:Spx/MgsR family transcriptional regulator
MLTIYGIKNCDTMKKARKWLADNGVEHRFHDYRADGLDETTLRGFVEQAGWEELLNRRGTTWRKLDESARDSVDEASAVALMLEQPALIKRPVLVGEHGIEVGFKAERYAELLGG